MIRFSKPEKMYIGSKVMILPEMIDNNFQLSKCNLQNEKEQTFTSLLAIRQVSKVINQHALSLIQ